MTTVVATIYKFKLAEKKPETQYFNSGHLLKNKIHSYQQI